LDQKNRTKSSRRCSTALRRSTMNEKLLMSGCAALGRVTAIDGGTTLTSGCAALDMST
jgi:hypothetical protein